MALNALKETLIYATYYAPRGRERLYILGKNLATRYVYPTDSLIGIIGEAGAGKSTLIKGLFPGLELTNDDEGVNISPNPIFDFDPEDFFSGHTFHMDIRYELAFHQKYEIVDAINMAISHNRRVIIEHFDMIYDELGFNAKLLFGIGEEVIVTRPSIFGPSPESIRKVVHKSIKYRLMAHSAEDITTFILERDYGYSAPTIHSDLKHGFIVGFRHKPQIDIQEIESKVQDIISKDVVIKKKDDTHIQIGDDMLYCTGVRTHVKSSGQIENFRLMPEYKYDPIEKEYLLVGRVGVKETLGFEEIAPVLEK